MVATKQRSTQHTRIVTEAEALDEMSFVPKEGDIFPPPPLEAPVEAPDPVDDGPMIYTDFSKEIAAFTIMRDRTEERRLHVIDQKMAIRVDSELDQYRRAVSLYERAQYIKPEARQFGSFRHKRLSVRIPPKVMSYAQREDMHLIGDNYKIVTSDPRFIVACLDLVKSRAVLDFHEMKPGLSALFIDGRGFMGWVEPGIMLAAQDIGAARNW